MPHDKNGVELKVGDTVSLQMTVAAVYPGADTCNVSLVRSEPDEQQLSLTCQAKQTTRIAEAPLVEEPAQTIADA